MRSVGKLREGQNGASPRRVGHWRLAAVGAVVLATAVSGCSSSGSSNASGKKVTITELDYYTTGNQNAAMNWYNQQFEAAHPGVTVKRQSVPFANLNTKVLQAASVGDMPNVLITANPYVPTVASTGQIRPLDNLSGFTTQGYFPGSMNECKFKGKYYCYPIGTNTIGLFYNKQMFTDAHLTPPTTWDELKADAKALTKNGVYGIAFDATADQQATLQFEPYMWSNGGSLTKVNSPEVVAALQLWTDLVHDGSASKSVLQWGQDPDLSQQFLQKRAAMIEDGPWILHELDAAGWKYNQQYGIVPIPVQNLQQKLVVPLGGEVEELGATGSAQQKDAAWQWIEGLQKPDTMLHVASALHYLPTKPSVTTEYLKGGEEYTVFADETKNARPQSTEYGANYGKVSQTIWTAIQAAITGTASPQAALDQAQSTVSGVPTVNGG